MIRLMLCLLLAIQAKAASGEFRIVGYYSLKEAMNTDLSSFPFQRLTHINLYFMNPDTAGNFNTNFEPIRKFIDAAHRRGVKVLPSIGGGGKHEYYHELLKNNKRTKLVNELNNIVLRYNFDGLDIDLEGEDIDENYEAFVHELSLKLRPQNKLLTAAIAVFYKDQFSDKALSYYDFVNLMSYDHTGPWNPQKPGPHSTYEHAVADLEYFRSERKIPKEKIVLGVGFYGYGFGPDTSSAATSMNYKQIVANHPGAENKDEIKLASGATMYYNGAETIRKKTVLAGANASGIMIWQIMGDADDEHSLLKIINKVKEEITKARE